jgi:ribosomal protein S18 acetylase RimI-like enzyme
MAQGSVRMIHGIFPARSDDDFFLAEKFLSREEKFFCSLAEEISAKKNSVHLIFVRGNLKCVFSFSQGGTFVSGAKNLDDETQVLLAEFFASKKIFCIVCAEEISEKIKSALFRAQKIRPVFLRRMMLMEFPQEKFSALNGMQTSEKKIDFKKCSLRDRDEIFSMNLEYEKEEVLPPGKKIFLPAEMLRTEKFLSDGKIFALKEKDEIVSMARLSAETENFFQIGGVFTKKKFRRKGFAFFLMQKILLESADKKKCAVLFADEKNSASVSLYKKIGFEIFGGMEIAYF